MDYRYTQPKTNTIRRTVPIWILLVCLLFATVAGTAGGIIGTKWYLSSQSTIESAAANKAAQELLLGNGAKAATDTEKSSGKIGAAAEGKESAGTTQTATSTSTVNNVMKSVVCIQTVVQRQGFYGVETNTGAGSGVIISSDGYLLTCAHVVDGASKVLVLDSENKEYEAEIVATSESTDLALLKIKAKGLTAAKFGKAGSSTVGESIYVVGNPLGNFVLSVSQGIISGLDRQVTIDRSSMELMQVDAAVNPGNSGGGLFNAKGELIGIVNAKNTGIDVEGMGFAIPIGTVEDVLKEIERKTDFKL